MTLHKASKIVQRTQAIGLLLFPGFSNLCLANAVEPLRAANTLARRPLYGWTHLALSPGPLLSSSGLPVTPERLTPGHSGDALFVMPSYNHREADTDPTRKALRAAAGRYKTLVGLDTGAWLLASAGLLDGHRATAHWDILTDLAERFPEVDVVEDRTVWDRTRVSCGGATTTLDLMLEMIERAHGAPLALEIAALFMYGERPARADPMRLLPPHRRVQAAAALMRRHLETPLALKDVARRLGMSHRSLLALFRSETDTTPAALYRKIRLAEARRRLEHSRESVAEIAGRCGYADATAFTRAYRMEFGQTPRVVRQNALGSRP
jgi:AraC family carnitine catabolism transcriptional activator